MREKGYTADWGLFPLQARMSCIRIHFQFLKRGKDEDNFVLVRPSLSHHEQERKKQQVCDHHGRWTR